MVRCRYYSAGRSLMVMNGWRDVKEPKQDRLRNIYLLSATVLNASLRRDRY